MNDLTKEFLNDLYKWLEEQNSFDYSVFGNNPYGDVGVNEETEELIKVDCPIETQYEIVDEPKGDKTDLEFETPEEYNFLTHQYCNQTCNGGYSGDDYYGYMYYPLPNNTYMKIFYSC